MCAFKDEHRERASDSCEEPTEMTAMTSGDTSSGETAATEIGEVDTSVRAHRKAFFKRYLRSPAGKCLLCVAVVSCCILLAYLLAKLVVGIIHIESCPLDNFVPIYLIVSSSLLIICIVVLIIVAIKCRREEHDERASPHHLIALVYFFLHLVLQLAGSVCVIRTRNDISELPVPENDITPREPLCDEGLLDFAFGVVIFELILSGITLVAVFLVLGEVIYLVCCQPDPVKQNVNGTGQ